MCFLEVIKNYSDKKYKIIVLLFFVIFFLVDIFSVGNYGYSTDENLQRNLGIQAVDLILKNDKAIYESVNTYHGTTFTMIADIIERTFRISNFFFMRHCLSFLLFFASIVFFYFLCKKIFKSWKSGLLGSLFLFLSPRIFVDSFYNPKDLPFLSFFIIAIFTLYIFLETKNIKFAFFHGVATSFAAGMRIIGVLIPVITIIFFIIDFAFEIKQDKSTEHSDVLKKVQALLVYLFVFIVLLCVLMPVLLPNFTANLTAAFHDATDYNNNNPSLFLGHWIESFKIPRSYLPVWMAITIPVFYLVLFIAGLCSFFTALRKNLFIFYRQNKLLIIAVLWFFIPVLDQVIQKTNIYNGWRQMYFVYPALLIFSVNGIKWIYDLLKKINLKYYNVLAAVTAIIIILNLGFISFVMLRIYPYEYAYFNFFAGKDLGVAEKNFTLDYWGMSYKYGLDYILKNDNRKKITYTTINGGSNLGPTLMYLFPKKDRDRLVYVAELTNADYYLSGYFYRNMEKVDIKKKIYTISIEGAPLVGIYKLK